MLLSRAHAVAPRPGREALSTQRGPTLPAWFTLTLLRAWGPRLGVE